MTISSLWFTTHPIASAGVCDREGSSRQGTGLEHRRTPREEAQAGKSYRRRFSSILLADDKLRPSLSHDTQAEIAQKIAQSTQTNKSRLKLLQVSLAKYFVYGCSYMTPL